MSQADQTTARWTYERIEGARDALDAVLARLDLDVYRFAIEPRGDVWEVQLEFATADGWKTTVLHVDESDLFASRSDPRVRDHLIDLLGMTLARAKRTVRR